MKRKTLIGLALTLLSCFAQAKTYMHVTTKDGKVQSFVIDSLYRGSYEVDDSASVSGYESIFGYVDMGNGFCWATCNLGAYAPEQTGDLYAWGETATKESYTKANYKLVDDSLPAKYASFSAKSDAASVNRDKYWRMPTNDEISYLQSICKTYRVDNYKNTGVAGCVYVSNINGNSLFLPKNDHRTEQADCN